MVTICLRPHIGFKDSNESSERISVGQVNCFFLKEITLCYFNFSWIYTCPAILYMLQVCNIVIHNFQSFYSIYSYYRILAVFPVLYDTSWHLIFHGVVCTSYSLPHLVLLLFPPPTCNRKVL